jgi:hypothetical protein
MCHHCALGFILAQSGCSDLLTKGFQIPIDDRYEVRGLKPQVFGNRVGIRILKPSALNT